MSLSNRHDAKYANKLQQDAQLLKSKITAAKTAICKANEEIRMYNHLKAIRQTTLDDLYSSADIHIRTTCIELRPKHEEEMLDYAIRIAKAMTKKNYAAYDLKIATHELKIVENLALEYEINLEIPAKPAVVEPKPKQADNNINLTLNLNMFAQPYTHSRRIKKTDHVEATGTVFTHPEKPKKTKR